MISDEAFCKILSVHPKGTLLRVYVQPRAKKNEIKGFHGNSVKIGLNTPPIENRANKALIEFLSDVTGVPQKKILILSGVRSRRKTLLFLDTSIKKLSFAKNITSL